MTEQVHETLILDGDRTSMAFCPPLPMNNPRLIESKESQGINSACWRGYVGFWEIKNGKFFLSAIEGKYQLSDGPPILADWFTGEIKIPKGEVLDYLYGGLSTVYEQELHISIKYGLVVGMSTIDNRPPFSEEGHLRIAGPWDAGIVLDWHTVDSQVTGKNEYGHPVFETTRTKIGELLYQFKYRSNSNALKELLALVGSQLSSAKGKIDLVLPIPPSNPTRTVTQQIAAGIASSLNASTSTTALVKSRATDELKSVTDIELRKELLTGVFAANAKKIRGKRVLLVDDLYRSGATLAASTEAVYAQGHAKAVYAFAVTRTRINR